MQNMQFVQIKSSKLDMKSLRERRRTRTADTIRRVAVELVHAKGLDAVTTEMISEEAGVSQRTFFNYFPFKEAALIPGPPAFPQEDIDRFATGTGPILDDLAALIAPMSAEIDGQGETMKKLLEISQSHPKLLMLKVNSFHNFEQVIATVLARRLGQDAQSHKTAFMAALIATAIRFAITEWSEKGTDTVQEHVERAFGDMRSVFAA